jgi:hypothetical protein
LWLQLKIFLQKFYMASCPTKFIQLLLMKSKWSIVSWVSLSLPDVKSSLITLLASYLAMMCLLHFVVQYIWVGSSVPGCSAVCFLVVLSVHLFVFSSLDEPCTGCAAPYGFRNIMSLSNNANRFSVSHVVFGY